MTNPGSASAGDTNAQEVEEQTTDKQEAQTTTQEEKESKNKWEKHLENTKQKLEEKDAAIAEEARKNKELEARIATVEANAERNIALAQFGEEAVDHELVKEARTRYPGMPYDEAIKLAGIEVKEVDRTKAYSMGGQAKVDFDDKKTSYTIAELEIIAEKDPKKYEELREKRAAGTVKFV